MTDETTVDKVNDAPEVVLPEQEAFDPWKIELNEGQKIEHSFDEENAMITFSFVDGDHKTTRVFPAGAYLKEDGSENTDAIKEVKYGQWMGFQNKIKLGLF